jgi:hypothetical protein
MAERGEKAVVHVSGTLLRQNWYGDERSNCIVVRPAGKERDTVGYIVHQVRFDGPTDLVFGAERRQPKGEGLLGKSTKGFVGTLPGFDSAILVYLEAEEHHIHVQANEGDEFIPLHEFKNRKELGVTTVNPQIEINC